jgi:hypothetical protein
MTAAPSNVTDRDGEVLRHAVKKRSFLLPAVTRQVQADAGQRLTAKWRPLAAADDLGTQSLRIWIAASTPELNPAAAHSG